ncbi:MAG: PAS domain-containing protein, partial [Mariprofundaceae bacterium]|nr:PAS domain-containing protein [Mariprofundaceae bacterium]
MTNHSSAPILLPRWLHLLAFMSLALLFGGGWWTIEKNNDLQHKQYATDRIISQVIENTQRYHLWLEEYLTHPTNENRQLFEDSLKQSKEAIHSLQQAVNPPDFKHHLTSKTNQLNQTLMQLGEIGRLRISSSLEMAGVDSPLDNAFDAMFNIFQEEAAQFREHLQQVFHGYQMAFITNSRLLLVFSMLFLTAIWITLIMIDRRRGDQQGKVLLLEKRAREQKNRELAALEASVETKNELLKQKEKLKLHIDQTPMGVIEWTPAFVVQGWNPAATKIFGYTEDEAIGRNAHGLILNDAMMDEIAQVTHDLVSKDGGYRSTNYNLTKDGRTLLCEWYNTPLVDQNDTVVGVASLVTDITELMRL